MSADIETPGTELARTTLSPASTAIMSVEHFDRTWRMARALANSGSFKDIGKDEAPKALARILLGADLGMSPTQALLGIDIVKGNPQIRGVALGRMIRASARRPLPSGESYDYAILSRGFTAGEEFAIVGLYRRNERGKWPKVKAEEGATFDTTLGPITIDQGERLPEGVEGFQISQAAKRNLIKQDGAWATQPEVMCVWRALSQLVRFHAPDAIGGQPVYTDADPIPQETVEPAWKGWEGQSVERAQWLEGLVVRAQEVGHAGLSDRHTILMRVRGMTDEACAAFVGEQMEELRQMAERQAQTKGTTPIVMDEDGIRPADTGAGVKTERVEFGGEAFLFEVDSDLHAMIMAALGEGVDAMRAVAEDFETAAEHGEGDDAAWFTRLAKAMRQNADYAEADAAGPETS